MLDAYQPIVRKLNHSAKLHICFSVKSLDNALEN
jgi:hypothetical protein